MNTITKLQLSDKLFTVGKDIILDQEESDSTTSAPSSAYIKSLIADINSRIDDLNTLLGNKSDKYNSLSGYGITDAYTKSEVDSKLNGKANSSHTHDDRYFTESEVNNLLNGKSNNGHTHDDRYYTESETNNLLNTKSTSRINGRHWTLDGYTTTLGTDKAYLLIIWSVANNDTAENLLGVFILLTGATNIAKSTVITLFRAEEVENDIVNYYPILNGTNLRINTIYQYMNYSLTEL